MTLPLPTNLQFGTVTWTAVAAVADGVDADHNPDPSPVSGTVTFTPTAKGPLLSIPPAGQAVTVFPDAVTCTVTNGSLLDPQGNPDPILVATDSAYVTPTDWEWTATYKLNSGRTRGSFSFKLPAGTTVDLTTVAPVSVSGGVQITQGPAGPVGATGPQGPAGLVTVDNGDGTFSISGATVTDNGDGTYSIA